MLPITKKTPLGLWKLFFRLWDCERLFFTLLVGDQYKELYNSIIIARIDFERLFSDHNLQIKCIEPIEDYEWLLLQK